MDMGLLFYLTRFALRWLEYLWLRTDQGPLGEAVWHKMAGIALLALALGQWGPRLGLNGSWRGIGLPATSTAKDIGIGMLLGSTAFALAYAAEITVLHWQGQTPRLAFYASSYTLQGNRAMHAGALFVLICLLGNLINVVMEEGVFRGLFMRWLLPVHGFWRAGLWSSLLFGLWHIAQPVRNVLDGTQSPAGALLAAMLLVISSALLGHAVRDAAAHYRHIVGRHGSPLPRQHHRQPAACACHNGHRLPLHAAHRHGANTIVHGCMEHIAPPAAVQPPNRS